MKKINVMIVFGTRPEAIKMAPVVKAMAGLNEIDSKVCVTGQHRQMLDQVLENFEISPDFDLNIMRESQDLTDVTSRVLSGIREIFRGYKPDIVLVHGDTTTAFAAALACFYHHVPVAHVEAGLRTGNLYSPWPEEANRKLITSLAALHFAPTESSRANLLAENVPDRNILVTGNTVVDALILTKQRIDSDPALLNQMAVTFPMTTGDKQLLLVTTHRRENFGQGFENICHALQIVAKRYPDMEIVFPVHPNPAVKGPVEALLNNIRNVHLLSPLEYAPFVYLMSRSTLVLTDSGGIQEEAPSFGKPVLVLRDTTERPEAVSAGTVKLLGTETTTIVDGISLLLNDTDLYAEMSTAHNPYGDGLAAQKIAIFIRDYFNG
jgi:UDP-N-acetylglucosamine 2-epimerase (non-hydrolysing)